MPQRRPFFDTTRTTTRRGTTSTAARGASWSSSSCPCSPGMRAVMYVLLVLLVAAIAYVLYRVIVDQRSSKYDGRYYYDDGRYARGAGNRFYYEPFADGSKVGKTKTTQEEQVLTGHQYSLIYLHMDGCGYCRRFDPVWEDLKAKHGQKMRKSGVSLESYESKSPESAKYYDATGFPTVLIAKGGNTVAVFEAERSVAELVKFVQAHTRYTP